MSGKLCGPLVGTPGGASLSHFQVSGKSDTSRREGSRHQETHRQLYDAFTDTTQPAGVPRVPEASRHTFDMGE